MQELPWAPPLDVAAALSATERCWGLLYSGAQTAHTGGHSFLLLHPQHIVAGGESGPLEAVLSSNQKALANAWFGYLGYELLHETHTLARETRSYITLPDLWFARFRLILSFDHRAQRVECWRAQDVAAPAWNFTPYAPAAAPKVESISSPMTRETYLRIVAETKEAIRRGDFYQANITRKFTGTFAQDADIAALFARLSAASPAAYSAVLRMEENAVISSSPERFLHMDAAGHMQSRPIKGTAPRHSDDTADTAAREGLRASEKDRAENLMIVDLMRNDLSRSAIAGSVKADSLFDIASYATVHHMESTVSAQKAPGVATMDAVRRAFPPGSMTGTPKIRAMQWCLEHEGIRRGVYSGALGWFGGDGSCDLSVVIRTLVVQGRRFEFQVGGAITADSEPEKEWQETIFKARGVMAALGLDVKRLEVI